MNTSAIFSPDSKSENDEFFTKNFSLNMKSNKAKENSKTLSKKTVVSHTMGLHDPEMLDRKVEEIRTLEVTGLDKVLQSSDAPGMPIKESHDSFSMWLRVVQLQNLRQEPGKEHPILCSSPAGSLRQDTQPKTVIRMQQSKFTNLSHRLHLSSSPKDQMIATHSEKT